MRRIHNGRWKSRYDFVNYELTWLEDKDYDESGGYYDDVVDSALMPLIIRFPESFERWVNELDGINDTGYQTFCSRYFP